MSQPNAGAQAPTKLVLSIAEAAEVLGVSDDLVYELPHGVSCHACGWADAR